MPVIKHNAGMAVDDGYIEAVDRMLDHIAEETTDSAADVMMVPASAYLNPEIFGREMELIFKRVPLLAGLSHELPASGDFKTIEILDKPVLITRQADGSLRAMLNVCTHRGAIITREKSGNCKRFSCPYHAWTFGADGRLLGVADAAKFGPVDKQELGLVQLPVWERAGLIFIVLTPELEVDFEDYFGGMIADLERFDFPSWHYCGQREITGANWKIAYDGYLEGYHFAAAHPETINKRTFSNIMHFEAFGPHLRIGFPLRTLDETFRDIPKADWWKYESETFDFIRTLFPNVSIFVAPEFTQIAQLIPGPTPDQNRTILYYVRSTPPQNAEEETKVIDTINWIRDVVDVEDYHLGLDVQKGLKSGASKNVIFGRNERGNQYFHKWVNYYLNEDIGAPKPSI